MDLLKDQYFVLAIDLPGIGGLDEIQGADKKTIASHIHQLLVQLNLNNPIVAGLSSIWRD